MLPGVRWETKQEDEIGDREGMDAGGVFFERFFGQVLAKSRVYESAIRPKAQVLMNKNLAENAV
jgi:hypothetical protein